MSGRDYYKDGVRDGREGGDPNPPKLTGLLGTIFNQEWEREANEDYRRGYKAGETSRNDD